MSEITSFHRDDNIAVTIITGEEGNTTKLEISRPDTNGIRTITKNDSERLDGKILGNTIEPTQGLHVIQKIAFGSTTATPSAIDENVCVGFSFTIQLLPKKNQAYHSRDVLSIEQTG